MFKSEERAFIETNGRNFPRKEDERRRFPVDDPTDDEVDRTSPVSVLNSTNDRESIEGSLLPSDGSPRSWLTPSYGEVNDEVGTLNSPLAATLHP